MKFTLLWLGVGAGMLAVPGTAGDHVANQRQPVLVELFTSEGCSSCPPADALLEKLDHEQPINGAQIIVLSEHVDYWNHLGWTDPFSSAAVTARQVTYDRRFGLDGPYTPEIVVDGSVECNGSDAHKAEAAIRQASQEPKVGIRIRASASSGTVELEVDPLPDGKVHKANVYVAHAADSGGSDVLRGENQGRKLHHVAIASDIRQVGSVSLHAGIKSQIPIGGAHAAPGSRLIAFVQEAGNGHVWGAAMYSVPKVAQP